MSQTQSWYALTVRSRHEKAVAQILDHKGLEGFLPLYRARHRWSDRTKTVELPLFPGYVFCRFRYANRLAVLSTPGVISVVGFAEKPAPVSDAEISGIRDILASKLPAGPWPYVRVGQMARIERGPLAGLEGMLVREKDALRVVVAVELLQRAVAVEIERDMIRAIQGSEQAGLAHLYLADRRKYDQQTA